MQNVEVKVPDIGEFTDVDVIELLVKPGDTVNVDDPLDRDRIREGDDGSAGAFGRRGQGT